MTLNYIVAAAVAAPLAVSAATAPQDTAHPYLERDNAWISIDGTVESVAADSFALDYGPGRITVEMDDRDRDAEGYKFMKGDMVRVNGRVDHNLFADTTIEASAVYVENLGTYFFASSADEEERLLTDTWPLRISSTTLRGTVKDVADASFTVSTEGGSTIRVETDRLAYDPLDAVGYQRVQQGDFVLVRGDLDTGFFDVNPELKAESLVVLDDASAQRSADAGRVSRAGN